MSDYIERWGDSIEQAVNEALALLHASRDEVDVTVLEQPSRGFLGFNKKLAKVRVQKKQLIKETPKTEQTERAEDIKTEAAPESEAGTADKAEDEDNVTTENINDDLIHTKRGDLRHRRDSGRYGAPRGRRRPDGRSGRRHSDRYRSAEFEYNFSESKFTVTDEDTDAISVPEAPGVKFVREIAEKMNLEISVTGNIIGDILYINLGGKAVGNLIGKRGQTLDAVQYLTSIVQNKNSDEHYRVIVNAERYREKRERTLQRLAGKIAEKCIKSGRNQRLEPMNPYERKVIHSTLQNHPGVTTRSEGSEPNRRVVVEFRDEPLPEAEGEAVKISEDIDNI